MDLKLKVSKRGIIATMVLLLFAGMVFLGVKSILFFESQYEQDLLSIASEEQKDQNFYPILSQGLSKDLDLAAKSYIVWDMQKQQVLGAKNADMQFPLASLTKLMTILIASRLSTQNTAITILPSDLITEGDSGLVEGERWKLPDLIDFVLLTSSNDGAQAMASIINATKTTIGQNRFVDIMNQEAKKIGLSQTYYLNETGLDVNKAISGGYGSAKDIALLVDYILKDYPHLLDISAQSRGKISSNLLEHEVENTNPIVSQLPNLLASKTGFTDLAGGNLMVVFDAGIGHRVIVSVLGSTKEERFSDVEKLVQATLEEIFKENQKT